MTGTKLKSTFTHAPLAGWLLSAVISTLPLAAQAGSLERAQLLFSRVAGVPIAMTDPRLAQMIALIDQNNLPGAAAIATADRSFYNVTVKQFAQPLSNRALDATTNLNDFVATVIGVTRDQKDARELLTGAYIYKADPTVNTTGFTAGGNNDIQRDDAIYRTNQHYDFLETNNVDLFAKLQMAPQKYYANNNAGTAATALPGSAAAGLLTSRAWAEAHLIAGTNRRATEYAMKIFLCSSINDPTTSFRDASLSEAYVRRDVDRAPGGDVGEYISNCRGCHAPMDAMTGAWAYHDSGDNGSAGFLLYTPGAVSGKYRRNINTYPDGTAVNNDSWVNLAVRNSNTRFGWPAMVTGSGVNAFGTMLANTYGFAQCMSRRVFESVCRRAPYAAEQPRIDAAARDFQTNGYLLKRLFERTAVSPGCLPR